MLTEPIFKEATVGQSIPNFTSITEPTFINYDLKCYLPPFHLPVASSPRHTHTHMFLIYYFRLPLVNGLGYSEIQHIHHYFQDYLYCMFKSKTQASSLPRNIAYSNM